MSALAGREETQSEGRGVESQAAQVQQVALLTRAALGRYAEIGWHREHTATMSIAGEILAVLPFGAEAAVPSDRVAPLLWRMGDRLTRTGVLTLAARCHELAAGLFRPGDPRFIQAFRSGVHLYSITGQKAGMLRMVTRHAISGWPPSERALGLCLLAIGHTLDGRTGLARRVLRDALAPELALDASVRAEALTVMAYTEVVDGHHELARVYATAALALVGPGDCVGSAAGIIAWLAGLGRGGTERPSIPMECYVRHPYIIPYAAAAEIVLACDDHLEHDRLLGAMEGGPETIRGHFGGGSLHGFAAGALDRLGCGGEAAAHRQQGLRHLYLSGLKLDAASRTLDRMGRLGSTLAAA